MSLYKMFRKKTWPPNKELTPWGAAPSIYDHIRAHIPTDKEVGLAEGGYRLPDEVAPDPNKISFAPGALDGVFGHHASSDDQDQAVFKLYAALKAATDDASKKTIFNLYSLIKETNALSIIDPLIERIVERQELDAERLREICVWFATKAADREPVKFAIALLGVMQGHDDSEIFLILGRHDEFTLYSAVAIAGNAACGEAKLFQLAKSAEGWGRINTVERLANTTDPEIQSWLIREGYKNDVMYEYLACICARSGRLHRALGAEHIDDGMFHAACEIIDTLMSGEGGPAESLADYEHGCSAVEQLLRHGTQRFNTAYHYRFLWDLKGRIEDHQSGDRKMQQDWTHESSAQILERLSEVVQDTKWRPIVQAALEDGDRQVFWDASRACEKLGIDPWSYFFERTQRGDEYWWDLMRTTNAERIDDVLELAETAIQLEKIETGPGDKMGLGPEYSHHSALDFVLQDLGKFPNKGWRLVKAGLSSPVIRNRNMAIKALDEWGQEKWPPEAREFLKSAASLEPQSDVNERLENLLA